MRTTSTELKDQGRRSITLTFFLQEQILRMIAKNQKDTSSKPATRYRDGGRPTNHIKKTDKKQGEGGEAVGSATN